MKDGIHHGLSREEYAALPRTNWSSLKHVGVSPAHYAHEVDVPSPPTASMAAGNAFHTALLEPHLFETRYVVWQGERRQGKAWEAFVEANPTRTILTRAEVLEARCMAEAARRGFGEA
jgi:hypothetical protein